MQHVLVMHWIDGLYWNGHSCNFSGMIINLIINKTKTVLAVKKSDRSEWLTLSQCGYWANGVRMSFLVLTFSIALK